MSCKYRKTRTKKGQYYCFCDHKKIKKEINTSKCEGCKYKEYKQYKPVKQRKPIKGKKHKRTKETDIPKKVKEEVLLRDKVCVVCHNEKRNRYSKCTL